MERRKFTRARYNVDARIEKGPDRWACEINDLSLKGAFLKVPAPLSVDDAVDVILSLPGGDATPLIRCRGRVVRAEDHIVGIEFNAMDPDSFAELRSVVSANTGDPETIEHEFAKFVQRNAELNHNHDSEPQEGDGK